MVIYFFPVSACAAAVQEKLKDCPEYSIDKMVKELRPDITLERLPPYHCELNVIEMIQAILKSKVRNIPFKHVKDVQVLAHRVFGEITPEMVRNVYEKVEEQEDWYRKLHNLEKLPVENIETINEDPESEMVEQLEEGVLRFDEDG